MLTKEQHAFRRRGIGGSEAAALFDLSPFKSQLELWTDKTRPDLKKELDRDTVRLRCGSHLESFVREQLAIADRLGKDIVYHGEDFGAASELIAEMQAGGIVYSKGEENLTHNIYPHMLGNNDGREEEYGSIVEIKTTNGMVHRRTWADGVPLYIQIQVQQYLEISDAPFAVVACLVDMTKVHVYVIERDREFGKKLGERIEAWWEEHVEGGVMPATDDSISCEKALRVLYPEPKPLEGVKLDPDASAAAFELVALRERERETKRAITGAKNRITAALGDASCGLIPDSDQAVFRTKTKRGTITIKVGAAPKENNA